MKPRSINRIPSIGRISLITLLAGALSACSAKAPPPIQEGAIPSIGPVVYGLRLGRNPNPDLRHTITIGVVDGIGTNIIYDNGKPISLLGFGYQVFGTSCSLQSNGQDQFACGDSRDVNPTPADIAAYGAFLESQKK